jgi:hypothetical protein
MMMRGRGMRLGRRRVGEASSSSRSLTTAQGEHTRALQHKYHEESEDDKALVANTSRSRFSHFSFQRHSVAVDNIVITWTFNYSISASAV